MRRETRQRGRHTRSSSQVASDAWLVALPTGILDNSRMRMVALELYERALEELLARIVVSPAETARARREGRHHARQTRRRVAGELVSTSSSPRAISTCSASTRDYRRAGFGLSRWWRSPLPPRGRDKKRASRRRASSCRRRRCSRFPARLRAAHRRQSSRGRVRIRDGARVLPIAGRLHHTPCRSPRALEAHHDRPLRISSIPAREGAAASIYSSPTIRRRRPS